MDQIARSREGRAWWNLQSSECAIVQKYDKLSGLERSFVTNGSCTLVGLYPMHSNLLAAFEKVT